MLDSASPQAAGTYVPPTEAEHPEESTRQNEINSDRWRPVLERLWRHKLDEVIALSKAFYDSPLGCRTHVMNETVLSSRQVGYRIDRAYLELANIEDAIASVEDGSHGVCSGCDCRMADEWLAEDPQVRYCPDCSLLLVSWQPRRVNRARRRDQVPPARPAEASRGQCAG